MKHFTSNDETNRLKKRESKSGIHEIEIDGSCIRLCMNV